MKSSSEKIPVVVRKELVRGGELLRNGNVEAAKDHFENALSLRPNDTKALGLLGLCCFRLADFERALPIYQRLVAENPEDASFRLNLGLVYLKLGNAPDAVSELHRSRELDPRQTRATTYIGLAYARNGQYALAYESFLQAGQNDLANEMEKHLPQDQYLRIRNRVAVVSGDVFTRQATGASLVGAQPYHEQDTKIERSGLFTPADNPRRDGYTMLGVPDRSGTTQPKGKGRHSTGLPTERTSDSQVWGQPSPSTRRELSHSGRVVRRAGAITQAVAVAVPSATASHKALRVAQGFSQATSIAEFATEGLVRVSDGSQGIEIGDDGVLVVRVTSKMYCRVGNFDVASVGLSESVAYQRLQGSTSTLAFDDSPNASYGSANKKAFSSEHGNSMAVLSGNGTVILQPSSGIRFRALRLEEDIVFIVRKYVCVFDPNLYWENGNLPGAGNTPVVQFRGDGCIGLQLYCNVLPVKVSPEASISVEASAIVGWVGRVIPKVSSQQTGNVECQGEGVLLIARPIQG